MDATRSHEELKSEDRRAAEDPRTTAGRPTSEHPRETGDREPMKPRETGDREGMKPREPDRPRRSVEAGSDPKPDQSVEHAPGQLQSEPTVDLWPGPAADGLRERWRELQMRFVDDPQAAAADADAVLGETIRVLSNSLQAARAELSDWRTKNDGDTEGLRVAVRRYRLFLDRVLAL